jgi:hypothetical protein
LAIWSSEGRPDPMAVNLVPVFASAEEWQANR